MVSSKTIEKGLFPFSEKEKLAELEKSGKLVILCVARPPKKEAKEFIGYKLEGNGGHAWTESDYNEQNKQGET